MAFAMVIAVWAGWGAMCLGAVMLNPAVVIVGLLLALTGGGYLRGARKGGC